MNWIQKIRDKKNLSQGEMAQRLGISQGYLSKLESDKMEPNLSVLKALVNKFKFNVNRWLRDE